jgi:hypothetical protein
MSGAILAWGIDLGHEDSVAAKLFESYDNGEPQDDYGWELFSYGAGHTRSALLLFRSVEIREPDADDFSVSDFIEVVLGTSGFPEMKSQPTSDEIEDLKDIINEVRPDKGVIDLVLQPLLLPLD